MPFIGSHGKPVLCSVVKLFPKRTNKKTKPVSFCKAPQSASLLEIHRVGGKYERIVVGDASGRTGLL